jgi:hypothetical protein
MDPKGWKTSGTAQRTCIQRSIDARSILVETTRCGNKTHTRPGLRCINPITVVGRMQVLRGFIVTRIGNRYRKHIQYMAVCGYIYRCIYTRSCGYPKALCYIQQAKRKGMKEKEYNENSRGKKRKRRIIEKISPKESLNALVVSY